MSADSEYYEKLGQMVRAVWVKYCESIGDTKPSHLAPWEYLDEPDKEVDRQIGRALALAGEITGLEESASMCQATLDDINKGGENWPNNAMTHRAFTAIVDLRDYFIEFGKFRQSQLDDLLK